MVWCERLLTQSAEWPHDARFPFRIWPGFAAVLLRRHEHCLWPAVFELAQRMLVPKSALLSATEARLWRITHSSSKAHAGHEPPYLVVSDASVNLDVLLLDTAFLSHLKWAVIKDGSSPVQVALLLLKHGVWHKRCDVPGLIGDNETVLLNPVLQAWERFMQSSLMDDPQAAAWVQRLQDPDIMTMLARK